MENSLLQLIIKEIASKESGVKVQFSMKYVLNEKRLIESDDRIFIRFNKKVIQLECT